MPRRLPDAPRLQAPADSSSINSDEVSTNEYLQFTPSFPRVLRQSNDALLTAHNSDMAALRAANELLQSQLRLPKVGQALLPPPAAPSKTSAKGSHFGVNFAEDTSLMRPNSLKPVSLSRQSSLDYEVAHPTLDSKTTTLSLVSTGGEISSTTDGRQPSPHLASFTGMTDATRSSAQAKKRTSILGFLGNPQAEERRRLSCVPDDLPDPIMLKTGQTTSDSIRLPTMVARTGNQASDNGRTPVHFDHTVSRRRNSIETIMGNQRSSLSPMRGSLLGEGDRGSLSSLPCVVEQSSQVLGIGHIPSTNQVGLEEQPVPLASKGSDAAHGTSSMFTEAGGDASFSISSEGSAFEVLLTWQYEDITRGEDMTSPKGSLGKRGNGRKKRWASKRLAATISNEDIVALSQRAMYEEISTTTCFRHFISYPSSRKRLVWDIIGMVLVLYDVVMIPLNVFPLEEQDNLNRLQFGMLIFWTLDVPASLTVGYLFKTKVVMHPAMIARRYLRSWFLCDVTILVFEWIMMITYFVAAGDNDTNNSTFSLIRTFRFFRTIRLLRFLKAQKTFHKLQELIHTEFIAVVTDILKLLILLVLLSHLMACGWYAIGKEGKDHGRDNWINQLHFHSVFYLYASSLHWSLTQFTPASMDVQPRNEPERIYAVAVLLAGLLVFSGMVSSITSSLVQLRKMSEDDAKQVWMLRRYLAERSVPPLLSARIHQYLEHMLDRGSRHVQEESVTILSMLSSGLRSELQYAIKTKHVVAHALFDHISKVTNATMFRLTDAMFRTLMACADTLFFQGEESHAMYFVVCGEMRFVQDEAQLGATTQSKRSMRYLNQKNVSSDSWMCEPSLWTNWCHLGDLHALVECDLITIDSDRFCQVMVQNPPVRGMVSQYARAFVKQLNMLQEDLLNDLCDCLDYDHLRKIMEAWLCGEEPPQFEPSPGIHRGETLRQRSIMSKSAISFTTKTLSMGIAKAYSMHSMPSLNRLKKTMSLSSGHSKAAKRQQSVDFQDHRNSLQTSLSPRAAMANDHGTGESATYRRSGTTTSDYAIARQGTLLEAETFAAPAPGRLGYSPDPSGTATSTEKNAIGSDNPTEEHFV